jgi:hypothetical protein
MAPHAIHLHFLHNFKAGKINLLVRSYSSVRMHYLIGLVAKEIGSVLF